jgi:hypothetical protein
VASSDRGKRPAGHSRAIAPTRQASQPHSSVEDRQIAAALLLPDAHDIRAIFIAAPDDAFRHPVSCRPIAQVFASGNRPNDEVAARDNADQPSILADGYHPQHGRCALPQPTR